MVTSLAIMSSDHDFSVPDAPFCDYVMGTAKRPLGGEGPLGERERASEEAVRRHWCWIHEEEERGSRDRGNYGRRPGT